MNNFNDLEKQINGIWSTNFDFSIKVLYTNNLINEYFEKYKISFLLEKTNNRGIEIIHSNKSKIIFSLIDLINYINNVELKIKFELLSNEHY